MSDVAFPLRIDSRGRTARAGRDDHIHQLIEQVLFTTPGERVNRPAFGCGLLQLVFQPNSEPLAIAMRAAVQAALHEWLAELIAVEKVDVRAEEEVLRVTVSYTVRATGEARADEFRSTP
jgi:uncharacterized protein